MNSISNYMSSIIVRLFQLQLLPVIILSFLIHPYCSGQKGELQQIKTIVIDAGHGGKDPGTVVGTAKEKNIVLDIALKLGYLIKKNQKNIKIVFTREGDYYIPLMDRAQIANKINADLFISIHANYCSSPEINGTETYVLGLHRTEDNLNVAKKENSVILLEDDYSKRYEGFNPNLSESYIMFELVQDAYLDQSLRFASILQSNFKELAMRHDREVRQAGFLVLRETSMPSVLIETGYLSNKKENSFLLTDAGRGEIAQSIYGSLLNYISKIDAKDKTTNQSEKSNLSQKSSVKMLNVPKSSDKELSENKIRNEKSNGNKKNISNTEKQKERSGTGVNAQIKNEINTTGKKTTYAIQIGVFSKKINADSKVFKGISPIREVVKDGKYKYFCFESATFDSAKANFNSVVHNFPDAFIVSIKENQIKLVWDGRSNK